MTELVQVGQALQAELEERGFRYCFIGGIAVLRWGEVRMTTDLDLTLLPGFGQEERASRETLSLYEGRVNGALQFALDYRVLLVRDRTGIAIDIALGSFPYEERAVERASLFEYLPGYSLRTCSAEDLIVMKCFAGRELDWHDVKSFLVRQGKSLNLEIVREELPPLAEAQKDFGMIERFERLAGEVSEG